MLELLGLRADLAVAAAFGAAFLVLSRNLTPRQSMAAVIGGIGSAVYFTALVAATLRAWSAVAAALQLLVLERAIAALLGLVGAFLLAGVIVLGERFSKDPVNTVKDLKP
jgi:hypothetical protein